MSGEIKVDIPESYSFLFEPSRYKVVYGGRGKGASWSFARALIILVLQKGLRVLCTREYQNSIADSVHRILEDQIDMMGLREHFHITHNSITCTANKGSFIFEGLKHNPTKIKSMEGIDIVWVAEAEKISNESFNILIPTIRKRSSEIWIEFNPDKATDPVYRKYVAKQRHNAIVKHMTFRDNPFFPEALREEMEYDKRVDYDKYLWIWEGKPREISEAQVFKGKFVVEPFETERFQPERFFFGADWGFSKDPTTLVRAFIVDKTLYIDYEAYGIGVDIDRTPELFDKVPGSRNGLIRADSARPETIRHMNKNGFNVAPSKKGKGSVEDGISYIRSFEQVVIHPRCTHTIEEFSTYSYKKDKITGEILSDVEDRNNHIIDALRYGLEIRRRSTGGKLTAAKLGL